MDARIAAAKATLGSAWSSSATTTSATRSSSSPTTPAIPTSSRARQPALPSRVHRLLRRALHGRERRRAERAASAGDPAGPRRRLLDGRHGRRPISSRCAGASSGDGRRTTSDAASIPVTYINSSASIKAFVGEHGGVVCTSSNAAATLTWAWERGESCCSCPISISAATPRTRWACRSIGWSSGIRTRSGAASSRTRCRRRA